MDVALLLEDFFRAVTEGLDVGLFDVVALAQLFDPLVEVIV